MCGVVVLHIGCTAPTQMAVWYQVMNKTEQHTRVEELSVYMTQMPRASIYTVAEGDG